MKFLIMVAASALSAILVLPTVSQGQGDSVYQHAAAAIGHDEPAERRA